MRRDVFQAIADPTRRAILLLVASQAMTPNTVAAYFNTSRQAISKHLRVLQECQLVKQDVQGREIFYEVNAVKLKEVDKWLEQFKRIWDSRFTALDEVLEQLKKKKKEKK